MSENEAQITSTQSPEQEVIHATDRQWIIASLGSALLLAIILFGAYRMS